jgi:hypothetical protein
MNVPDTLYNIAEYSRCFNCGCKAELYASQEDYEQGMCGQCWIEQTTTIVDALPQPDTSD